MIGQSEQMVLIAAAIETTADDLAIRQILQVVADLAAKKPRNGVHPAENREKLGDEHIDGMHLPHVRLLMEQNLVQLAVGIRRGTQEYRAKEGEGAVRPVEQPDLYIPHARFRASPRQRRYPGEALHPVQLYEAGGQFLLCFLYLNIRSYRAIPPSLDTRARKWTMSRSERSCEVL